MTVSFDSIWSALPFPAFVIASDNTVTVSNAAAEQLQNLSARQMRGRDITEMFGRNTVFGDTIHQAREGANRITQYNVVLSVADLRAMPCNLHVCSISPNDNALLVIVQPTGSTEKIHRSLTHLAAARSVTAMAGMLAHEIRNPLAGISGAAQLLGMNAGPEDAELAELIGQEARRIGQLVDRVELFVDQRPVERRPVNVHDVLDRACRGAQAGYARNVSFLKDFDPSLPEASGDPDQLLRAFQNIVKNATESVDPLRGVIRIRTFYKSGIKFAAKGAKSESVPLHIEIIDNGPGIPSDLLPEIFEPFVTSKAKGNGLGLSLVSQVVAAHGGLVECESEAGRTVFRVRLPLWRQVEERA